MITIHIKGDLAESRGFLENVHLFALAESLGGVESLIEHPAIMTQASVPPDNRAKLGISDSLVRLAVGIESADDLLADLAQALDKTFQTETLFQAVNGSGRVSPVIVYRR
jgi:cystathionine gamma-lyase